MYHRFKAKKSAIHQTLMKQSRFTFYTAANRMIPVGIKPEVVEKHMEVAEYKNSVHTKSKRVNIKKLKLTKAVESEEESESSGEEDDDDFQKYSDNDKGDKLNIEDDDDILKDEFDGSTSNTKSITPKYQFMQDSDDDDFLEIPFSNIKSKETTKNQTSNSYSYSMKRDIPNSTSSTKYDIENSKFDQIFEKENLNNFQDTPTCSKRKFNEILSTSTNQPFKRLCKKKIID